MTFAAQLGSNSPVFQIQLNPQGQFNLHALITNPAHGLTTNVHFMFLRRQWQRMWASNPTEEHCIVRSPFDCPNIIDFLIAVNLCEWTFFNH
eukprot:8177531-Karenia_brevis.AAC.1